MLSLPMRYVAALCAVRANGPPFGSQASMHASCPRSTCLLPLNTYSLNATIGTYFPPALFRNTALTFGFAAQDSRRTCEVCDIPQDYASADI
jgi:hypothetical protein